MLERQTNNEGLRETIIKPTPTLIKAEVKKPLNAWEIKDYRISVAQSHNLAANELLERKIFSDNAYFEEELLKAGKVFLKVLLERFDVELPR